MPHNSLLRRIVRWGLSELYTHFAFAYDWVSYIVSRGEWCAWTRAAIPFIQGTRVLEIAHGTGSLHLDLHDAGLTPIGIDLSPNMGAFTLKKFRARKKKRRNSFVRASKHCHFPTIRFRRS